MDIANVTSADLEQLGTQIFESAKAVLSADFNAIAVEDQQILQNAAQRMAKLVMAKAQGQNVQDDIDWIEVTFLELAVRNEVAAIKIFWDQVKNIMSTVAAVLLKVAIP